MWFRPTPSAVLFTLLLAIGQAMAEETSDTASSGILIQAERFDSRHPDDGSFALEARSPFAYGGHSLARFFPAGGRCGYQFAVEDAGVYQLWLRYAAIRDQKIRFAVDPAPVADADNAKRASLQGTGALSGQDAWTWALLDKIKLAAGKHRLTLYAGTLRPDCIWISRNDAPPEEREVNAERLEQVRSHLTDPIEPISPHWLGEADDYQLPQWYDGIRVCAHTRLSWTWLNKNPDLFLGAGSRFASLGFKEYSRHIKSGGEGAWWPSEVGAVQPEAQTTNYAQQIIDDAHKTGCRILVYHRHMEDVQLAKEHPDWCARDSKGQLLQKRGPKLCFNTRYADFVETRLVELTRMGADGFYFDEVHMPKPFCWCDICQQKFKAETGMDYPTESDSYDPAFQKAIEFKNVTIERLFRRWRTAIHAISPDTVLLIGSNSYPQMIDRHTTHRLWRIADSMKTEFSLPARASANRVFDVDQTIAPTETDARLALGYALARDACDGRPPHVWVHGLPDARHARFATAGLVAHGAIANLDHSENTIPDPQLFADAVALGNRMSPAFAGMRPLRWAAVHYSEYARDHYLPDESLAWKQVLYPLYGSFTTLLRQRVPVGIVTDSQLEQNRLDGYRVLIIPAPQHLTERMKVAIKQFQQAGGLVVEQQAPWKWHDPEGMAVAKESLLASLAPAFKHVPVRVVGGTEKMHAITFDSSDASRLTVALVNDFSWVFTGQRRSRSGEPIPGVEERINCPPPPRCRNVTIYLANKRKIAKMFDVVTGDPLEAVETGDGLQIKVPPFDCVSVVVIDREGE